MIQALISPVAGLASSWLAGRAAKSKAKAALELAVIENKTRLALSETECEPRMAEHSGSTSRTRTSGCGGSAIQCLQRLYL